MVYILAGIALVLFLFIAVCYDKGIKLKNYVLEAFSTMDVYLKKRWDLVPNLTAVVKGYVKHERTTLEDVTSIRSTNYSSLSNEQKIDTNLKLSNALTNIIAIAENYPELKSNENFSQLMTELVKIEDDIANSRKYYNGSVRLLNNFVQSFPTNIISMIFNFKEAKMFEANSEERESVRMDLK